MAKAKGKAKAILKSFSAASNDIVADPRYTYDKHGNVLKFDDGKFWYKRTLDEKGNELRLENSHGFWFETTYDTNGKILTEKNVNGFTTQYTRDSAGNPLTFKNSKGRYVKYNRDEQGNLLSTVAVTV